MSDLNKDLSAKMDKTIAALHADLAKVRTGRASPSLLDHIVVDCYDNEVPVNQLASISSTNPSELVLNVWDKNMIQPIDKAIRQSDLGINPTVQGTAVYLSIPPLTEERRKELTKIVQKHGEQAKIAIRNIRRDANQGIKKMLKDKKISADEETDSLAEVQQATDQFIAQIDSILKSKEEDLMHL